ncbi:MAG: glycosyltransferase family 1 protein [Chthoniobacteraceae bacterium]
MKPLRVAIDARFPSGKMGGIEQFVLGLIDGLARLEPGGERYHLLVNDGQADWLEGRLWPGAELLFTRRGAGRRVFSDGTIEAAGIDVMHFSWQFAFLTRVPSIYHPHDLQHLHLPRNFSFADRIGRSLLYRLFCHRASIVSAGTEWTARDFVRQLGLSAAKVRIMNLAPVIQSYARADEAALRAKHRLPADFIFYPAQTWPHKNHIRLIEALGQLRRDCPVNLVCTGALSREHQPKIEAAARAAGVEANVQFLGFVSPAELRALYAMCRLVCIPTTFESASFPMWEAFEMGAPVACSTVTSLPAQAGGAALLFDPNDVQAIAAAIRRLWEDDAERARLRALGEQRVKQFTWEKTARLFRAHYRQLGGCASAEDQELIAGAPLI